MELFRINMLHTFPDCLQGLGAGLGSKPLCLKEQGDKRAGGGYRGTLWTHSCARNPPLSSSLLLSGPELSDTTIYQP